MQLSNRIYIAVVETQNQFMFLDIFLDFNDVLNKIYGNDVDHQRNNIVIRCVINFEVGYLKVKPETKSVEKFEPNQKADSGDEAISVTQQAKTNYLQTLNYY